MSSVAASLVRPDHSAVNAEGTVLLSELNITSAVAGLYDASRQHLTPTAWTSSLSALPEEVHALAGLTADSEFVAWVSPASGPILVLPRGVDSAIRVKPSSTSDASNVVAFARGPSKYSALMDAVTSLAAATGVSASDMRSYALPLLDYINRSAFNEERSPSTLGAKSPSSAAADKAGSNPATAAAVQALEAHLYSSVLVQEGHDTPAKPLTQAPMLRSCLGMAQPLRVCYSGMAVVYGTATNHVLAVMDTPSALRMAPSSGMRISSGGAPLGSLARALSISAAAGNESPAGVSAGVSTASSGSATPTGAGRLSRTNSTAGSGSGTASGEAPAEAAAVAAAAPTLSLAGRSIVAAPIIQIVAGQDAALSNAASASEGAAAPLATATTAPARVLASFGIVGVKGRGLPTVGFCRVMPASALAAAAAAAATAASADSDAAPSVASALGVALEVEVTAASASTLLVFLEAAASRLRKAPVRGVALDGRPAAWAYDAEGCMLTVELPASAAPGARAVQVYL
ncbi:hypothetical protein HYH03_009860 [Edaphochlamys debaryana]|uniref:Uncharacterized protein n=1 Tax=Edaphochlamys debaryana TaxID=47281 RepID=A0A835XVI1_9CHLO|nr:hypothetical protein HYH03_009860 [Edaphochlamys debaryana]|eukprot:KAG2491912.1 hypothetical protein HYH03_009860 [Edaphochlamys debaryana]